MADVCSWCGVGQDWPGITNHIVECPYYGTRFEQVESSRVPAELYDYSDAVLENLDKQMTTHEYQADRNEQIRRLVEVIADYDGGVLTTDQLQQIASAIWLRAYVRFN